MDLQVPSGWATNPAATFLDLSWAEVGNPDSAYHLNVVRGGWEGEIVTLRHRSWKVLQEAVNLTFAKVIGERSPAVLADDFARLAQRP